MFARQVVMDNMTKVRTEFPWKYLIVSHETPFHSAYLTLLQSDLLATTSQKTDLTSALQSTCS